jgi:hypothetical protein
MVPQARSSRLDEGRTSMLRTVLLIFLALLILGSLPAWPYSAGWGYFPSGTLGLLLIVLIVLALVDRRSSSV